MIIGSNAAGPAARLILIKIAGAQSGQLQPTTADIEQVSVWLEGGPDVFGAGELVQGVASEIAAILAEKEEEEPPRAG